MRSLIFLCRLVTLSTCNDDPSDLSDLELIQHMNMDLARLSKLLNGNTY